MSRGADNRRDLTDCRGGPRERRRKHYKPQYALLSFGGARGKKQKFLEAREAGCVLGHMGVFFGRRRAALWNL